MSRFRLTLVYAYYENPEMFRYQQQVWGSYPERIRKRLEIIVTDDCSERTPIQSVIIPDQPINMQVFRILKKVPWNWLEARNIGAKYAAAPWLLLTDMDHVVQAKMIQSLFSRLPDLVRTMVYQFGRQLMNGGIPYHPHNDSFLVAKQLFWQCGGYDEDYAGLYGTSGMFRRRLFEFSSGHLRWSDLSLHLVQREQIPDASTVGLPRKEGRRGDEIAKVTAWKGEHARIAPVHFRQPFEKVFSCAASANP